MLVALVLGADFAWPRLKARYQRWNAGQWVRQAEEWLGGKDFQRAVLTARAVLAVDPQNVSATRIIAKALEASGAPEAAQWRNRLDSLDPGNVENLLARAADTIKAGDIAATERVLGMLPPGALETAACHEIQAQLSTANRDTAAAEQHWAEAVRLDPNRMLPAALATFRMRLRDAAFRDDALAVLTELSEQSPRNLQAIRLLLDDALRLEEWKRAERLSKILAEAPAATFGDKLMKLASLRRIGTQEAPGYLRSCAMARSPSRTNSTRSTWMNENKLAMLVSEAGRRARCRGM